MCWVAFALQVLRTWILINCLYWKKKFVQFLEVIFSTPLTMKTLNPADICLFKGNSGNTRTMCEICLEL